MNLLIYSLKKDILSGKSLYYSMQRHSAFNPLTCELIKIGETSGKLEEILLKISQQYQQTYLHQQKIRQALLYPIIVLLTGLLITLSMFLCVIPKFIELFSDIQTPLPLLTRIIFSISIFLQQNFILFLLLLSGIGFLIYNYKKIKFLNFNFFILVPAFKKIYTQTMMVNFTYNFSLTISAGLSILDGLPLAIKSSGFPKWQELIAKTHLQLIAGSPLHQTLSLIPSIPDFMINMIQIGENSGKLDSILKIISIILENELTQKLHIQKQLLEPLIMLGLGALIGGLVIGMYLPLFKLGSAL